MMKGSPRAKYSGGKPPLYSDLRARGVRGEPISMSKLCLSRVLEQNIPEVNYLSIRISGREVFEGNLYR